MNTSKKNITTFIVLTFIYLSCTTKQYTVTIPEEPNQTNISITNQLKILSWNIKMLPAPYGWFFNRNERAENIIQLLRASDPYDIIFFQEAFSGSIRSKIYAGLHNIYPHEVAPEDQTKFYKINSGLWVISRLPIALENQISFTKFRKWDKLASKGAKLFSIIKDEQKFYLINTHMQSDYEIDYSDIRKSQYTEINNKLILPNKESLIPLILCGDLNIPNSNKLKSTLKKLQLINGPLFSKLKHTIVGSSKEIMDYILVKADHFKFKSIERRIIDFSTKLKEENNNLSDHYPIEAVFSW